VAEGRHNTRQLAIKAFADGDFLLRAAQVKPSSTDARVLSRKAPTSIFAIDKASVAFASCVGLCPTALVGGVRRGGTVVQERAHDAEDGKRLSRSSQRAVRWLAT
jgi:hypothetical protein